MLLCAWTAVPYGAAQAARIDRRAVDSGPHPCVAQDNTVPTGLLNMFTRKIGGTVRYAANGRPVAGAVVFVWWLANNGRSTYVLHVDSVRTDTDGHYEMANWSGFDWRLLERRRWYGVYKAGYVFDGLDGGDLRIRALEDGADPFANLPVVQRVNWGEGSGNMGKPNKVEAGLYWLLAAMAADLKPLADTPQRKDQVAILEEKARSALADESKPIEASAHFFAVNVNPKDSLRPQDIGR